VAVTTHTIDAVYVPLKITYGLIPLLAGIDKFTNLLTSWEAYLAPAIRQLLPVAPSTFMKAVGVVEILVGLAILTMLTRLGAYLAMAWLIAISINLILAGYLDVAVRDLTMAVGAYSLGTMAGLKGLAWLPGNSPRAAEVGIHAPSTR